MEDISLDAAWFREALRLGVCSIDDLVAWSDRSLSERATPSYDFVELSSMQHAHPLDILGKLSVLAKGISTATVLPAVLGSAHVLLKNDPSFGPGLAAALEQIASELNYNLPDDLRSMVGFSDEYALARHGHYGTEHDVYCELLEFTGKFRAHAIQRLEADALKRTAQPRR